jgi:predicted AAA+ superfamily ATPase
VTGSSSLELASRINEPLTGRKHTLTLGPISFAELAAHEDTFQARQRLESLLRFGGYPGCLALQGEEEQHLYLRALANDYLYRDILDLGLVKKPPELQKLLRLLAHQVGQEVSFNEIGSKIGMDSKSVDRYIELLEQSFVLFRLGSFGTNLRREVSRRQKIYFWDLGIRNALLDKFEPLEARYDTGALWENFLIAERRKKLYSNFELATDYFWRTRNGSEVDYVELEAGKPHAYEFKWGTGRPRHRQAWANQYPDAPLQLVNQDNFTDFIA